LYDLVHFLIPYQVFGVRAFEVWMW